MISIESAQSYLEVRFGPERKRLIKTLRDIKDVVQGVTKTNTAANVFYGSAVIVGGVVFLTGCLATKTPFLLQVGLYLGVSSRLIKACHGRISNEFLLKKLTDAVTRLKEHEITSSRMVELLSSVNKSIDSAKWLQKNLTTMEKAIDDRKMKYEKIHPLINEFGSIIDENIAHEEKASGISRLVKIGKSLNKALFKTIIGSIESLIKNSSDLANYKKGELCTHARVIDIMLEDLQWELNMYEDLFEKIRVKPAFEKHLLGEIHN